MTKQITNNQATYSPEDNKIRIYLSERLNKEDWQRFKDAGYSWTMKQESDLAATWSPTREDLAFEFCGDIEDHDIDTRADRAADRAERFAGYRDKRENEARESLDNTVETIGMQSEKKAATVARRSQRAATKATNNWNKAEYWQTRTEGVIANALYSEKPAVRFRRIKKIEASLRKNEKCFNEVIKERKALRKIVALGDEEKAETFSGWYLRSHRIDYKIAESKGYLAALKEIKFYPMLRNIRYRNHYKLRLAYENQMLQAQGGDYREKSSNYKVGGTFKNLIILKINKSSGVVASVTVFDPNLKEEMIVSVEGIPHNNYQEPTPESKKALKEYKLEKNPPLLNLSLEDSAKLCRGKGEVVEMTQKEYTAYTKRYDGYGTYFILEGGEITRYRRAKGKRLFKVRASVGGFCYRDISIIHLTDKAVKAMPEVKEYEKV